MALLGAAAASVGKCAAASMRFQKDRSGLKEPPAFVARGSCFCGSGFPSWTADPLWVSWLACYGDITGPRSEVSLSGAESLEKGKHTRSTCSSTTRAVTRTADAGCRTAFPAPRCRRASPRSRSLPDGRVPAATAGPGRVLRASATRVRRFRRARARRARVRPERGRGHDRAEAVLLTRRHGAWRLRARVAARHHARRLGSVGRDSRTRKWLEAFARAAPTCSRRSATRSPRASLSGQMQNVVRRARREPAAACCTRTCARWRRRSASGDDCVRRRT